MPLVINSTLMFALFFIPNINKHGRNESLINCEVDVTIANDKNVYPLIYITYINYQNFCPLSNDKGIINFHCVCVSACVLAFGRQMEDSLSKGNTKDLKAF